VEWMVYSLYLAARLISPWVVTDEGRKFMEVADPWVCAPCLNSLFPFEIDGKGGVVDRGTFLRRISVCVYFL